MGRAGGCLCICPLGALRSDAVRAGARLAPTLNHRGTGVRPPRRQPRSNPPHDSIPPIVTPGLWLPSRPDLVLPGRPRPSRTAHGLERAIHQAVDAVARILGQAFVEDAVRRWESAVAKGRRPALGSFTEKVVGAVRTADALCDGTTPPQLEAALWVALVADAATAALEVDGAEAVVARLAGADGDQAGFELVAGVHLAQRLVPSGSSASTVRGALRFVAPRKDAPTPDLAIRIAGHAVLGGRDGEDAGWIMVECKRQDERSGAEVRRGRLMRHVAAGVHKIVDRASLPCSVYIFTAQEPDDGARGAIRKLVRACVDAAHRLPDGAEVVRESPAAGGTRVVVRPARTRSPGALPSVGFGHGGAVAVADMAGATASFRLLASPADPHTPYALTMRLGPPLGPTGALRRFNEARAQLPPAGPGVVGIWLRDSAPLDRDAIAERLRARFTPGGNTRISGVLLAWLDVEAGLMPSLREVPDLSRCLGTQLLINPHASVPLTVRS